MFFINFFYDVAILVYLQLKIRICLFTKHVLFKIEKCGSFPEDSLVLSRNFLTSAVNKKIAT